jgi:hypothetical protein
MLPWKRRRDVPRADLTSKFHPASPGREASTLLAFIAGEFADEIAHLWPAPHTAFLVAPAARRHLVFLALALQRGAEGWTAGAAFAGQALGAPLKTAIRALAPGAPAGLARALGRVGETAWSHEDYGLLLQRLADPKTAKVLRHADAISAGEVRALGSLPGALVEAGGSLLRLTEDQSALLAECYAGIVQRDGPDAAGRIAARWAQAPTAACLFKQAAADLTPWQVDPPHPGTARLVPLADKRALAEAALRYRNCLEGRVLDGSNHYYEWLGSPGAIVCVGKDHLFGWRLDEALGEANSPVDPASRSALEAELRAMGVHVGRSAWTLEQLAREAGRGGFALPPQEEAVAEAFGG